MTEITEEEASLREGRQQRLSDRLKAYTQQCIDDEIARERRDQEERAKAPEEEEEWSVSSISSDLSISLEADSDEGLTLRQVLHKWKVKSTEATSAPEPAPAPEQTEPATEPKKGSFRELASDVSQFIDQPQSFRRKATLKELYEFRLQEAEERKRAEAERKKLAEEKAAQQRLKDKELIMQRAREQRERLPPQSKQKEQALQVAEVSSEESSDERLFVEAIQEIRAEELDSEFLQAHAEDMRNYFAANPGMTDQEKSDYLLALRLQQQEQEGAAEQEKDRLIWEQQIRRGAGPSGIKKGGKGGGKKGQPTKKGR